MGIDGQSIVLKNIQTQFLYNYYAFIYIHKKIHQHPRNKESSHSGLSNTYFHTIKKKKIIHSIKDEKNKKTLLSM